MLWSKPKPRSGTAFINILEKPDDWLFKMYEEGSFPMEESQPPLEMEVPPKMDVETQTQPSVHTFDSEEIALASQLRDSIATEMWNDFIQ
ncbi:hypothetical protein JHK82_018066 [Glycine max]|nr:hypothetical protein JHK82_018066 [Glycine max]